MKENFNCKALYRTVGHDDNISKKSFTNEFCFPLNFNNSDDFSITPEKFTVKAQPALLSK